MNSHCKKEDLYIDKMNKFQLSHKFKKVGYYFSYFIFALMIAKKFVDEPLWVKPLLSGLLLVGLLLISISKDKIEDEYIDSLRSQSYRISFILVILYTLIQPFINYGVGILIDPTEEFQSVNYFQILFYMLIVQLMIFWRLKKVK